MNTIPASLPEQVERIRDLEITYDTLHPKAYLYDKKSDSTIKIPYSSITSKYKDYLSTIILSVELDDDDKRKYWYRPKSFSYDIYKTTELWDTLLILNNATSIAQFTPNVIKYYDPNRLKSFLNEILIIEKII